MFGGGRLCVCLIEQTNTNGSQVGLYFSKHHHHPFPPPPLPSSTSFSSHSSVLLSPSSPSSVSCHLSVLLSLSSDSSVSSHLSVILSLPLPLLFLLISLLLFSPPLPSFNLYSPSSSSSSLFFSFLAFFSSSLFYLFISLVSSFFCSSHPLSPSVPLTLSSVLPPLL